MLQNTFFDDSPVRKEGSALISHILFDHFSKFSITSWYFLSTPPFRQIRFEIEHLEKRV